jgi:hypothetical protein
MTRTPPIASEDEDDRGWDRYCDDEFDDEDREELPYWPKPLTEFSDDELQREWRRQCTIHDCGVDSLPLGHPTIESAQSRLNQVERELKRRGLGVDLDRIDVLEEAEERRREKLAEDLEY